MFPFIDNHDMWWFVIILKWDQDMLSQIESYQMVRLKSNWKSSNYGKVGMKMTPTATKTQSAHAT